jgi:hypothetical protein
VGNNPVNYHDPFGLFEVESGFDGKGLSFSEYNKARHDYYETPVGKREMLLRRLGERFQEKINKLCEKDRKKLQEIFDKWKVYVDENIDNPAKRIRGTYGDTWYSDQRTRFNYWLFNSDNQFFNFSHEFRHLMDENDALASSSYIGNRLKGNGDATRQVLEEDADKWAKDFMDGKCTCEH